MTTDRILVERVTDGERCSSECRGYNWGADLCIYFEANLQYDNGPHLRCPSCLSTPSAPALTAGQVEAVKDVLERADIVASELAVDLPEELLKLRTAFALGGEGGNNDLS